MKTPICDFVENYIEQNNLRLHMPGHKGCGLLGFEKFDITEITGADSLYGANDIIKKSQKNTSDFFGCHTFFSTEGSTQCIKAMLYLAIKGSYSKPLIAAGRNAHKAFLSAAAVLDFDIDWIGNSNQYLSSDITEQYLENYFTKAKIIPNALYITTPDYLGNMLDIGSISRVCKKYNVLLLVDNAHGAYLKFLSNSLHPMDLGADMCADSAHKTLPALTGGAYLHISKKSNKSFKENAPSALAMFGSTSPSYLILQSLDKLNLYFETFERVLKDYIPLIDKLKIDLINLGFELIGNEPLKITLNTKPFGYTGKYLAKKLEQKGIYAEFYDPDFLTLMFTPQITAKDLSNLFSVLSTVKAKKPIIETFTMPTVSKTKMSVRDVFFAEIELVSIADSLGRIFADFNPPCPPAVPIAMVGEEITSSTISALKYYGIKKIKVVKE